MFFSDAPLQVKQGLLRFCEICVAHYNDPGFQQRIDDVKSAHTRFATEYGFMDFNENYVCSEEDKNELNAMISTLDIYQKIAKYSVRIFLKYFTKTFCFSHGKDHDPIVT